MNVFERALDWAITSHRGQTDRAGRPYLVHVCQVIAGVDTDEEKAVAALHDVVEDAENPQRMGMMVRSAFAGPIADAVMAITKRDTENYDTYLGRVAANDLARKVKLVDLQHNADLSRLPDPTDKDRKRALKYRLAIERLNGGL